jgi:CubicO group peptidase (beta-lactamase class C family)
MDVAEIVDEVARESGFSGAVRVDRSGVVELEAAYGLANRAYNIANRVDMQFAVASGTKTLTALAVMSLVDDGALSLDTTARSVLGADLPLVGDGVTVEHLLAHRSGIGDYMDEDTDLDVDAFFPQGGAHLLVSTEDYVRVLDGYATKFAPDTGFSYCNGGFVILALIAERVSRTPFAQLLRDSVCEPAGMNDTAFLRSDSLPGRAAIGYIGQDGLRTNVFNLPIIGGGDGGIYTTVADIRSLWTALFAGKIVRPDTLAAMIAPRSQLPSGSARYGLGFWLHATRPIVELEGMDAGVSFRSAHDPAIDLTYTVIGNTTDGAFPVARRLKELFEG